MGLKVGWIQMVKMWNGCGWVKSGKDGKGLNIGRRKQLNCGCVDDLEPCYIGYRSVEKHKVDDWLCYSHYHTFEH